LNSGGLFGATADWTGSSSMILNGINGVFTFQTADADGTVHNITLTGGLSGSGSLNKTGGGTLHLGATNSYSGNTLINAGILAVDAGGSLTSPLIIVGSGTTFDVSAVSGGFMLKAGQTLSGFGSGSVNGIVTTAPTTGLPAPIINPGSNALTGTLTFQNDLVEQGGAINHFDLSGDPLGTGNDFIIVTGNLTVIGTNVIETGGAPQNGAAYALIQYGTFNGDLTNFTTLSGTLSNSVANKIIYLIAQSNNHPPTNVTWLGNSVTNNWDMLISTNWSINGTGPATNFVSGDNARFDNTGASYPLVNLVGGVVPGSVTVDSTSDYTFTGAGSITGNGGLTKTNSGKLIILTTNSYTGITTISGGILAVPYLASGSSACAIGAANSDPANLVINNATLSYFGPSTSIDRGVTLAANSGGSLDITNSTTLTESGTLTGDGGLIKAGPGTLNLTGNGDYTGTTTLSNGTLQVNGPTTIGSGTINFAGGTLTIPHSSSQVFYNNTLNLVANGSLVYVGADANAVLQGAWSGSGTLNLNITNSVGICTLNHDITTNFTGTILLTDNSLGTFRFNSGGGSSGAQVCTGSPTATFDLGNSFVTLVNRNGGGTNGIYYLGALAGGTNTMLRGGANSGSTASTYQIGGKNIDTTYSGAITNGSGGVGATVAVTKVGTGTLTLNGDLVVTVTLDSVGDEITNYALGNPITYTGPTTISNGVLVLITPVTLSNSPTVTLAGTAAVLNASQMGYISNQFDSDGITVTNQFLVTNGLFEVYSGQTLAGIGTIRGQMLADSGSTLNVGLPTGSLTVTNGVELAGTVNMNVNAASSPNSSEIVSPSFTIDGTATLTVTNIGPENAATFQLFSRAVSFAPASVTLPTLTGTNSWVNNLAYDGSITLVAPPLVTVNPNSTNVTFAVTGAGNTLTLNLSWPADHIGWRLLEQTNPVTVGLVNNTNDWFVVTNATTTNQISIPINVTNGTAFFRLVYP
jgi:autotransporter-associated beta strand protein